MFILYIYLGIVFLVLPMLYFLNFIFYKRKTFIIIEELKKCGMNDISKNLFNAIEYYGIFPNDGSFGKGNRVVAKAWKLFRKSSLPKNAKSLRKLQLFAKILLYLIRIFLFLFFLPFLFFICYIIKIQF